MLIRAKVERSVTSKYPNHENSKSRVGLSTTVNELGFCAGICGCPVILSLDFWLVQP